jgi:hypothetical protein
MYSTIGASLYYVGLSQSAREGFCHTGQGGSEFRGARRARTESEWIGVDRVHRLTSDGSGVVGYR